MIAKVTRGESGAGLVRYLFGKGDERGEKKNLHTDQRVIASGSSVDVRLGELSQRERVDLGHQLDAAHDLFATEFKDGHIWHLSLTNPAGDRSLSDAEWSKIAHDTMDRLGFTEGPDRAPCRWVAVRHGLSEAGNDHIHVAVSLVRDDGSRADIFRDRVKLSEACATFERDYGLTVVDGRNREPVPGVSRAEDELAARRGRPEAERETLARHVRAASVAARDEAEFVRQLRAQGVIARPRYGKGGEREVVGYSVALRPAQPGAEPVWYGGGTLARDLRLPALRGTWDRSPTADREALAAWKSDRLGMFEAKRPGAWDRATDRVAAVNGHLAGLSPTDTARWSSAARETAGVAAQLAARLEPAGPGPLSATADLLARSAQLYDADRQVVRDGPVRDLRGIAGVAGQGRRPSGAEIAPLLDGLSTSVRHVAGAHAARGEVLQARHLERAAGDVAALGVTLAAIQRLLPDDRFVSKLIGEEVEHSPIDDEDEMRRRGRDGRDRERGFGR